MNVFQPKMKRPALHRHAAVFAGACLSLLASAAAQAVTVRGFEGTYYDLPLGFPTSNEAAQQRLSDPSIPRAIKKLIQENFPLPARPVGVVQRQLG